MMKKTFSILFLITMMLFTTQAFAFATGPLQKAVMANDLNRVKSLLKSGTDINSREWTKGRTALMLAAEHNYLDIVKFLLDSGADINIRSTSGSTALHYATWADNTDMAIMLCQYGANPQAVNKQYVMPASIAVAHKNGVLINLWGLKPRPKTLW